MMGHIISLVAASVLVGVPVFFLGELAEGLGLLGGCLSATCFMFVTVLCLACLVMVMSQMLHEVAALGKALSGR